MSVSSASSWSDTTDIIASATPVRLREVKIRPNPDSVLNSYVQLFNSADATPGTTLPDEVIYVPRADQAGRVVDYLVSWGKGKYFNTGLTWFVSTTATGATAATTSAPLLVDVHYVQGG